MHDKFTPTNDNHDRVQELWEAICTEAEKHMNFFAWVLFSNTPFEEFQDRSLVQLATEGDVDAMQMALDMILAEEAKEAGVAV